MKLEAMDLTIAEVRRIHVKRTILIALVSCGLLACTPGAESAAESENALDAETASTGSPAERPVEAETGLGVPEFPDEPAASTITVPSGTEIVVEISSTLTAAESSADDAFRGVLAAPVEVDGATAFRAGSAVTGRVVSARESGRVQGVARIELTLSSIESGGQTYPVSTASFVAEAATERTEDAQRIGVGAGLGALVGAIAGGGEGAAIGAAIGGGAGTAVVLTDRGDDVVLPAETSIRFLLDESLTVSQ